MANCLGLYIEENLIKYAKVSKEKEITKIDSYGIKFYDDIDVAIEQILQETYSFNIPKSINLSNELYNYFDAFSSLSKKDFNSFIKTSFEIFCEENNLKSNNFETRFLVQDSQENLDKKNIINVAVEKEKLSKNIPESIAKTKISTITPLSISILNILNKSTISDYMVVNLEENVILTLVSMGKIVKIITLDIGMKDVFQKLNSKVNSYSKAYEILKNSTLYTEAGRELLEENDEYLACIMPVLYTITEQIKSSIKNTEFNMENIFLTGTGAIINNIDLYFEDIFKNVNCSIIKPYFIENVASIQINIKDYIEVNSAIALALEGVGLGNKEINFAKASIGDLLKIEAGSNKSKQFSNFSQTLQEKIKIKNDFKMPLDGKEKVLIVILQFLLILVVIYGFVSKTTLNKINEKYTETTNYIEDTQLEILKIESDTNALKIKENNYLDAKNSFIKNKDELIEKYKRLNVIPNFLNELMYIVPTQVVITNIQVVNSGENFENINTKEEKTDAASEQTTTDLENDISNIEETTITETAQGTTDNSQIVQITAQSPYYDELGALIAKLKNGSNGEGAILTSIKVEEVSSSLELTTIKITGEIN